MLPPQMFGVRSIDQNDSIMITQTFQSTFHRPLTGHQNIVFFNLLD